MTDSEQTPEPETSGALVHLPQPLQPEEGESYQAAHERMLREGRGHEQIEVLGVLTGQVPVGSTTSSMPISMNNPIGPEENQHEEQDGSD